MNLAAFAEWAIRDGAWQGCHLDGGEVQDKATEFGILVKTKYDPEIHGESAEAERGDDWYVFSDAFKSALAR